MTLTRVDLPAPLSPTRATTSPAWTSTDAPSSAWTEPKDLVMFRIEISGVPRLARGEATAAEWGCVLAMIDLLGGKGRRSRRPRRITQPSLVGLAHGRALDALADLRP